MDGANKTYQKKVSSKGQFGKVKSAMVPFDIEICIMHEEDVEESKMRNDQPETSHAFIRKYGLIIIIIAERFA